MEQIKEKTEILDLIVGPAFLVKNHTIIQCNRAAAGMLLQEGSNVDSLLLSGKEEYAQFTSGCLYINLSIGGEIWGASIVPTAAGDVFTLDLPAESPELQAMALAARELRGPLAEAMIVSQRIQEHTGSDSSLQEKASHLNRKLYQLLRLVGNMSDAAGISPAKHKQLMELDSFFSEILEKVSVLSEASGVTLTYQSLSKETMSLVNAPLLERATLNLISNALKFTPKGGHIQVCLSQREKKVLLQVSDDGEPIPDEIRSTLFSRYLRQPVIEEGRQGIGLGMQIIRSAAAAHNGTVLIDQPEPNCTRVTLTIAIDKRISPTLRSPILTVDYAGEQDHALIELSDVLPSSLYEKN